MVEWIKMMTTEFEQPNILPPAEKPPRDGSVAVALTCLIIGSAVIVVGYLSVILLTGGAYGNLIIKLDNPALYVMVGLFVTAVVAIIFWLAALIFSLRVIRRLYCEQAFADIARARTIIIASSLLLLFVTASSIVVYADYYQAQKSVSSNGLTTR